MLSFDSPVETVWHKVPVPIKLAFLCVATVVLFSINNWHTQLVCLLLVLAMYLLAGVEFVRNGLKRLLFLWPFLLIIALWHLFTDTTVDGIVIALRLVAIIALSNLMTMTSKLSDILEFIHSLLKPFRSLGFNTRPVELAVALVVRFSPVLLAKSDALRLSWTARSARRPAWRLLFPLSLIAIDDAEHVAEALKARGGAQRSKVR